MATLYRKYRPQNFAEIIGQNHIKLTLQHEIESNKLAHAYLFCGPRAVGKTTMARILAKSVNCQNRPANKHEPCNQCGICVEISALRSMDIIEIDAASYTGVDNVRENIIANARVMPVKCKYKVFIIDEVHMLSTSAFNALLKIIEEPPAYVIFILCTTEVHKVPATIISRCQRFDFKRISVVEIAGKLERIANKENIKINKTILEAIARHSEGHMRDAESLLGQIVSISGKEVTSEEADLVIPRSNINEVINLIGYLKNKDAANAISLINRMIDEGVDLKAFITDLVELLRKMMLALINPSLSERLGISLGENLEAKISQAGNGLALNRVVVFIEKFRLVRNELKNSFIVQIPVETAIVELCLDARDNDSGRVQPPYGQAGQAVENPAKNIKPESRAPLRQSSINLDLILERWGEVLAKIKKHNHSLSFILRVCQPKDISGNQVCLAFKYKFHKERIGDAAIKPLVEGVLKEVYGLPLTIEAIIDENLNANQQDFPVKTQADNGMEENNGSAAAEDDKAGENLVDNLLKTFGGKVVN